MQRMLQRVSISRGKTIFRFHISTDFPQASRKWRPCTKGWANHVASLATELKRKIPALAKNQNLILRCSVDNAVRIVSELTREEREKCEEREKKTNKMQQLDVYY